MFAVRVVAVLFLAAWAALPARAADTPAMPKSPAYQRTTLSTEHEYQRTLRTYLAGLTEKDFDHGITAKFTTPAAGNDVEDHYHHWLLSTLGQPLVGSKRGMPAVNAPAKLFTLAALETPKGVMRPPLWPEPVAFLVSWNYPGNPYYRSAAMTRRAFVALCVHLTMLDDLLEHAPEAGGNRSDHLAGSVLMLAQPYPTLRGDLPAPVRQAYETGLRKMGRRLLEWGPRGEEPHLDIVAVPALWYISQALGDPKFAEEVETFARQLFADQRFFHPAGYYVDHGGLDLGFAGQANFFATWTALATRWPFAREAVDRAYRLRAHLCLPEPEGKYVGPSHFHTRFSADVSRDQWEWGIFRDTAAALVTDEAVYLNKLPAPVVLADGPAQRARAFQGQINENPVSAARTGFLRNDEIGNSPWVFRRWQSYNFPAMVNFAYDHYPQGAYAHRLQLEKDQSPLLQSPFLRAGSFVRAFDKAFTVTKQPGYSAIVHTGAVGGAEVGDGLAVLPGPYGFGGGQLSAYWTPATGAVLLGRRGGMTRDKNFDPLEDWRRWPIHAVSGVRPDGTVFTTARNRQPAVTQEIGEHRGVVRVTGTLPRTMLGQAKALEGRWTYLRNFALEAEALRVETTVQTTGQDTVAELYETLPVYLGADVTQAKVTPTSIEFSTGADRWLPAGETWTAGVKAVRLTRHGRAVVIALDRARRVKLAPAWNDTYLSKASCRNVLIDLLETGDQPRVLRETSISWRIQPVQTP